MSPLPALERKTVDGRCTFAAEPFRPYRADYRMDPYPALAAARAASPIHCTSLTSIGS